jgi:quinol monooxygenase YgiN
MPLMFLYKYYFDSKKEVQKFYQYPALAHTLHILFTILPLVFANFHVGYVSWYSTFFLEAAIYVSAPMTHILYCAWAWDYDQICQQTSKMEENDKANTNGKAETKNGLIPKEYRIKDVKKYIIIGFFMGMVALVAVPTLVLEACPTQPHCVPDGIITGTSVATVHRGMGPAFEDLVESKKLVESARHFPGNLGYELVADVKNKNEYRFIEKWASRVALRSWLENEKDPVPKALFASENMKGLLVGEALNSMEGYFDPVSPSCHAKVHGGVSFDVNSRCAAVWNVVGDWGNCEWVIGCKFAAVEKNTAGDPKRRMEMENGDTLIVYRRDFSLKARTLLYEVTEPAPFSGYSGEISLEDKGKHCSLTYKFTTPSGPGHVPVDFVYADFYNNRVPALQEMFSK